MKYIIPIAVCLIAILIFQFSLLTGLAVGIWVFFICELFIGVNKSIAFREFMLTLYGLNYLFAPALSYNLSLNQGFYEMSIPEDRYFEIAISCMLALRIGLYWIKTDLFKLNYNVIQIQSLVNEKVLKIWLLGGMGLFVTSKLFPSELGYFVYLMSMIRFVAAFSLYSLNKKKYRWYLIAVLVLEFSDSLVYGTFHDTVIWLILFGLFLAYRENPSAKKKFLVLGLAIIGYFMLQIVKGEYRRDLVGGKSSGFSTFSSSAIRTVGSENDLLDEKNLSNSLTRINQAWIFASTINNMDRTKDFQNLNLVGKYIEAALLPRFLAPNKLEAGDKEIFNRFSGHEISVGTSMGLGIFADGYIGFGFWGSVIFSLFFGLIFGLVFKVVEGWTKISPFYMLFIFPILCYAVRPDCETQTVINHLVKALVVYFILVRMFKSSFKLSQQEIRFHLARLRLSGGQ